MKAKEFRTNSEQNKCNLYERVASQIGLLIQNGTFRAGYRIPSIRRIHQELKVSITTAMQAYRLLEDQGIIEVRPQSGFFVLPQYPKPSRVPDMARVDPDPTFIQISDYFRAIIRDVGNPDIVQLGSLQPDPEMLPVHRLSLTLSAAVRRDKRRSLLYDEIQGYRPLRVEIARHLLAARCVVDPEEIIITSGCSEAILLSLIATCQPGDTVAVESPVFFNLLMLFELFRIKVVEIPTHPVDGIALDALQRALKEHPIRACFANPNFSTPTGSCMPEESKKRLVEMLADRDIPLIEDDIYGDVYYHGDRPAAAKAFDAKGLVLSCSSFSKTLAPGFRVGWVVPGRFKSRIEQSKSVANYATATPPQMAIAEFLAGGGYRRHLKNIRRRYAEKISAMIDAVEKFFPEETKVIRPKGGFSLWVELPEQVDSLKLYEQAHQRRISFVPGPLFSPRQSYRNFLRLNGAMWSEKTEKAVAIIGHLAERLRMGR
jgi:DNA-binding transcriptional MocR family regulator